MDQQLIVYRSYDNFDRCAELTSLLNQHNIPFETEQFQKSKDELFTGRYSGALQFIVKISPTDLSRANTLYEYSLATTENHSFHLLSNKELEGVLVDSEEWAAGDIHMARLILAKRNIRPDEKKLELARMQKREEFCAPETGHPLNIALAFLLPYFCIPVLLLHAPLFFSFFLAGSGFAIGLYFKSNYRRDKEGTRYAQYCARTRKWGLLAMIHALMFVLTLLYLEMKSNSVASNTNTSSTNTSFSA
jgi:hypothetical protein